MTRHLLSTFTLIALLSTSAPLARPAFALTLDEAISTALAANPGLEAMRHRSAAVAAAVQEARASRYPTLSASLGYTRTDNPPQAFFMTLNQRQASFERDVNQPSDTDNFRGSLSASMLLLDGGSRSLATRAASLHHQSAKSHEHAARNDLVAQVTRAYYHVLQAESLVAVFEETVTSIEASLRIAQDRFEAGAVNRTDVLNLDVQLAEAREQLIRVRHARQLAVSTLNLAIGESILPHHATLDHTSLTLTPPPADLDIHTIVSRPEWTSAGHAVEATRLEAQRPGRDRLPRLSAFGSIDWDSETLSDPERSYLAGAILEVDIFTGFRRSAEKARAASLQLEAEANLRALENQLRLELESAHLSARDAWERIEVSTHRLTSADEVYRITLERYQQGAADITELLNAQVSLTQARSHSTSTRFDYAIALADLTRALGATQTAFGDTP
ncbi:MAG TPA: TolC family protein [Kiritimatiellia bacterium]|nr:TolC family protein [Kiritimatiellia bacterium]